MLESAANLYGRTTAPEEIMRLQLRRLNEVWSWASSCVPFYKMWKSRHSLPGLIQNVADLDCFPLLTKAVVNEHRDLIFSAFPSRAATLSTGGSTGVPTVFPTDRGFADANYVNTFVGRGRWGIAPLEETLLIWGHSHLFGSGIRGRVAQLRRMAADWVVNIARYNAYDLSLGTIERYVEAIRSSNPAVIVGYTSAIYKIAKYCEENNIQLRSKGKLKGVIVTAETVTNADIELIRRAFGVPCIIEYGMAEAGSIAYSHSEADNLEIFWDSFVARASSDGHLTLSSTRQCYFPLINYATSDRVTVRREVAGSVLAIGLVQGRTKDVLTVRAVDGGTISLGGILMVHALKNHPGVYQISFKQSKEMVVKISVVASSSIDVLHLKSYFFDNISRSCPGIDINSFEFERVDSLPKTVAGKEMLITHGDNNKWTNC